MSYNNNILCFKYFFIYNYRVIVLLVFCFIYYIYVTTIKLHHVIKLTLYHNISLIINNNHRTNNVLTEELYFLWYYIQHKQNN